MTRQSEHVVDDRNERRGAPEQAAALASALGLDEIDCRSDRVTALREVVAKLGDVPLASEKVDVELAAEPADGEQAADHEVRVEIERVALVDCIHEFGQALSRLLPVELQHAEDQVRPVERRPLAVDAHEDLEHIGLGLPERAVARQVLVDGR